MVDIKSHRCISQIRDDTRKEFMALQTDLLDGEDFGLQENETGLPVVTLEPTKVMEPAKNFALRTATVSDESDKASEDVHEMVIHVQADGQNELMAVHVKYNLNYLIPTGNNDVNGQTEKKEDATLEVVDIKYESSKEKEKEPNDLKEVNEEELKKFKCEECGKKFKKKHNFSQHIGNFKFWCFNAQKIALFIL